MEENSQQLYSVEALLTRLEKRGLHIRYQEKAIHHLRQIGYYRFRGYCSFFYADEKCFTEGTTFDDVLNIYILDRRLRILTLEAIERIEIALRVSINEVMIQKDNTGLWWDLDDKTYHNYCDKTKKDKILSLAKNFKEVGQNYRNKKHPILRTHWQKNEMQPPFWKLMEFLTFGDISKLFGLLKQNIQQEICRMMTPATPKVWHCAQSWFQMLNNIRNISAHHQRFWNAKHVTDLKPYKDIKYPRLGLLTGDRSTFATLLICRFMLDQLSPNHTWWERLIMLFKEHNILENNKLREEMGIRPEDLT